MFERLGYRRVDSDALVREQVLTQATVVTAVRDRFGKGVLAMDGSIDRAQLAQRVFANEEDRQWLEELTHPLLFDLWRQTLASTTAERWVVEAPLLFEKNLENWFDFTLCVACAPDQQLARLEQRGLPHALAEQRISKQLPLARKIELADFVLWNDGNVEFLQDQVNELNRTLPVGH